MNQNFEKFKKKVEQLFNHYNAGNYPFVIQQVNLLLKKQPKNFNVLNNLGLACTELKDFKQAEEFYNSAIKLNPNFPDPLVNLGNLKTKQNKSEEAKNLFIKALKINDKIIMKIFGNPSRIIATIPYNFSFFRKYFNH